ncbi:MAG TPA: DUF6502 family protein [Ideonella sp.]|uniref:DUF6502 family protein n=1 Tax=Ideonella sp. TaxID=1929293 RepID=UPI002E3217C2|nr:DUF6502 family protein [Ideonella sp.]HEX5683460.1 DUF6502 family protein [Ideonella sp.]
MTLVRAQRVLETAVATLLRPLFRVLLRQSMSFIAFEEIAKRVYVEVAMKDFSIEGKAPSMSRAAILSGLTRKEVARLLAQLPPDEHEPEQRYNRAARVLTGWLRDADFLAPDGTPRSLRDEGPHGFAELVRRYSGDMPARAVYDELVRVGAVRRGDDGRIEPLARAYVPSTSVGDKLAILGTDVADLIATIEHNIDHGRAEPRFQRKVMYHRIAAAHLPGLRRLSAVQSQALLERLDRWLQEHDTGVPDSGPEPRAARVGVGIYYFEEPLQEQEQERPNSATGFSGDDT